MKTTIHFFSFDTQHGMDSPLFTSREDLAAEIHQTVENYDPDRATVMRALTFECDDWLEQWQEFKDEQSDRQNYFNYGSQELDIPAPGESSCSIEWTLTPENPHTWQIWKRKSCLGEPQAQEIVWGEHLAEAFARASNPKHKMRSFRILRRTTAVEVLELKHKPQQVKPRPSK